MADMSPELVENLNQVAEKMGDKNVLYMKENKLLPNYLREGEYVIAMTQGTTASTGPLKLGFWSVYLTNHRLLFLSKHWFKGTGDSVEFDLSRIISVSGKSGITAGQLSIEDSSITHSMSVKMKKTVVPFANALSDMLANRREGQQMPSPPSSDSDVVNQLERLAALKEKGILTQEEFEQQKKKILTI